MPKVEDVSIWPRSAVDPASALRVLLPPFLALPTHFLLPLLRPYLPLPLQRIDNPFMPFFLLYHPTPARSASLPQGHRRPRAARPRCCAALLPALGAQSYVVPDAGAELGIRKAGKMSRFGEQRYVVVYFAVVGAIHLLVVPHMLHFPPSLLTLFPLPPPPSFLRSFVPLFLCSFVPPFLPLLTLSLPSLSFHSSLFPLPSFPSPLPSYTLHTLHHPGSSAFSPSHFWLGRRCYVGGFLLLESKGCLDCASMALDVGGLGYSRFAP
ncbi:hypothetical protein B0H13DRAFT_2359693 [Mycena leptocephala]|nr:hypothetical protein B0H13DRAFT_2359693 [Mycena leptocephala]